MRNRSCQSGRLIVKVKRDSRLGESLERADTRAETLGLGSEGETWATMESPSAELMEHPWDLAHASLVRPEMIGLESAPDYAEPDFVQEFPYQSFETGEIESSGRDGACVLSGPDDFWPPHGPRSDFPFAWHLDDSHSGLRSARQRVGSPASGGKRVRIAILDTGYDPQHVTLPLFLRADLQRNFAGGDPLDARDPNSNFPTDQPGHGTATMALLAGQKIRHAAFPQFDDFLGGAPEAEIVPVRIADSVMHFGSHAMAQGIEYAIDAGCDVVSISMGGVPARAWAAAVNRAYEAGVVIFAAAGIRFGPTLPGTIVYPARFGRVVAVCGATFDKQPYHKAGLHRKMQGCFGPPSKMSTALAAYTPNTPWAILGCHDVVTIDGGGTSSATPQSAAAAALWIQANLPESGFQGWQKVEAVRHALFASADKSHPESAVYFGQGMLQAVSALNVPFRTDLPKVPEDEVSFPWLRLLGVLESVEHPSGSDLMYEVEALQIFEQTPSLQRLTAGADTSRDRLDEFTQKHLFQGLASSALASKALRTYLNRRLSAGE